MKDPMLNGLLSKALAQEILQFVDLTREETLVQRVNCNALALLAKIKDILDDPDLNDSECFLHIDAIVDAFDEEGLFTPRHSELD